MSEDDADRAAREWLKQSRLAERYHVGSLAAMLRRYGQKQRNADKEFVIIMATACWKNAPMNAAGMGGYALHYNAVREACERHRIKFSPRKDEASR